MSDTSQRRLLRISAWFLAISYGVGAPLVGVAEFRGAVLSARFGLPPELIYVTCAIQLASAPAVLVPALAPWAAMALSVTTIGAIGAHLTTATPLRAIPAVACTVLQVWFGLETWRARRQTPAASRD
jgi:hypothetical protein